jgi:hypothetical protein
MVDNFSVEQRAGAVPEPGSMGLIGLTAMGLAVALRRRKR